MLQKLNQNNFWAITSLQSIRINRKAQILKHVEFSAQHIFNTTYFHVTKWPLIPPSPPLHPPRPPLPHYTTPISLKTRITIHISHWGSSRRSSPSRRQWLFHFLSSPLSVFTRKRGLLHRWQLTWWFRHGRRWMWRRHVRILRPRRRRPSCMRLFNQGNVVNF